MGKRFTAGLPSVFCPYSYELILINNALTIGPNCLRHRPIRLLYELQKNTRIARYAKFS